MALRILHTSDWHLGRNLHEEPLIADQGWALDRLFGLLKDARPDALVVAGDVYDRAVPPTEAVALLDDFLCRVADLGVPVVAIAGNHDSAERVAFGARLLVHHNLSSAPPGLTRAWEWNEVHRSEAESTAQVESKLREVLSTLPKSFSAEASLSSGPVAPYKNPQPTARIKLRESRLGAREASVTQQSVTSRHAPAYGQNSQAAMESRPGFACALSRNVASPPVQSTAPMISARVGCR